MPRPRPASAANARDACALGIDLGGTHLRTLAWSPARGLLVRRKVPSRVSEGPAALLRRMASEARAVRALSGLRPSAFRAVGVGAPGPLDPRRGIILDSPNLPGFASAPLAAALRRATGLPVALENDARCAAWAEYTLGAGRGGRDLACLTLGTGVGGGLVLDGRLRVGPDATAGELGFLYVDPSGPRASFGPPGSLEAFASATGIARMARAALARRRRGPLWRLCGGRPARVSAAMAHAALRLGDPSAREAFRRAGAALGVGVAGLINALNLDCVVLCGGVMDGGGRELLAQVRETARRACYAAPFRRCRIVAGELGDDAGAVGAALLALLALHASSSAASAAERARRRR